MYKIVNRLRLLVETDANRSVKDSALVQAADEIERLEAEIKRLRSVVVLCPRCMEADRG